MHTNMLEVKLICYDLIVLVVIVFFLSKRTSCGPSEEGMIHCPFFFTCQNDITAFVTNCPHMTWLKDSSSRSAPWLIYNNSFKIHIATSSIYIFNSVAPNYNFKLGNPSVHGQISNVINSYYKDASLSLSNYFLINGLLKHLPQHIKDWKSKSF